MKRQRLRIRLRTPSRNSKTIPIGCRAPSHPKFAYEPFGHPAPNVPPSYNERVAALDKGYQAAIYRALRYGCLDGVEAGGEWFVSRYDLEDQAGPGSDTYDPAGGCFIPDDAMVRAAAPADAV